MSPSRYSRRRFLGQLGLAAGLVPLLEADLARAQDGGARAAGGPRRLVVLFWPNGAPVEDFWPPEGPLSEASLPFDAWPLRAYLDRLLFVRGLENTGALDATTNAITSSHDGVCSLLTAQRPVRTTLGAAAPSVVLLQGGVGPSLDQFLGSYFAALEPLRYATLTLAAQSNLGIATSLGADRLSWSATGVALTPREDPLALFHELFAPAEDTAAAAARLRNQRSVLDRVRESLRSMASQVSTADRARLDAHLDLVRNLELQFTPRGPLACALPSAPVGTSATDPRVLDRTCASMIDLLVASLRCGLTRVASLQIGNGLADNQVFPWLGGGFTVRCEGLDRAACVAASCDWLDTGCDASQARLSSTGGVVGCHGLAHAATPGAQPYRAQKSLVNQWFLQQLARLLDGLAATPEGDGTMLDHTLVLALSNMGEGYLHNAYNLPVLLAGNGGAALPMGRSRWLNGAPLADTRRVEQAPLSRLLGSILEAFGVPTAGFGSSAYSLAPLSLG